MFKFNLQLFGGGGSTTQSRNIPEQSSQEAALQSGLYGYAMPGVTNAANLQNRGYNALGQTYNPDWLNLGQNYNTTMGNVSQGYSDLAQGNLPSQYAANRQQALNADLQGTMGNMVSGMGGRGIINSSVTGNEMNQIGRNAADTLARNYTADLGTQAGLLSGQAGMAGNALAGNQAAQQGSYYQPSQLYNYAQQSYAPASNLFNTLYGGRMQSGGTTTSQSSSPWGAVGELGSAAILCFAGGTKITTPDGEKNIEDIKLGDKVISDNYSTIETVTYIQEPCMSNDEYMTIKFDNKEVTTTAMQTFIFANQDIFAKDLPHIPAEKVLVYDFTTTGSNTYYANGFLVRGR